MDISNFPRKEFNFKKKVDNPLKRILNDFFNLFKKNNKLTKSPAKEVYLESKKFFYSILYNIPGLSSKDKYLNTFTEILTYCYKNEKINVLFVILKYVSLSRKVQTENNLISFLDNLPELIDHLNELMQNHQLKWSELNLYNDIYEIYPDFFRWILDLFDKDK